MDSSDVGGLIVLGLVLAVAYAVKFRQRYARSLRNRLRDRWRARMRAFGVARAGEPDGRVPEGRPGSDVWRGAKMAFGGCVVLPAALLVGFVLLALLISALGSGG